MREENFLYRLGLSLAPALFFVRSPEEAVDVSLAGILVLGVLDGWVFLVKKAFEQAQRDASRVPETSRDGGPFALELALVVAVAFLAVIVPQVMTKLWRPAVSLGTNFFVPVVLGNLMLLWMHETQPVKGRAVLWFAFALLIFNLVGSFDIMEALKSPVALFPILGVFLATLGAFARRGAWIL